MSSPDRSRGRPRAVAISAVVALAAGFAAGCTVQPLHGGSTSFTSAAGTAAEAQMLASVDVAPVDTREAQQVRNHLIFLLGGGQGQPSQPAYTLTLNVNASHSRAARIQIGTDDEPTSQTVTMRARYMLRDNATGRPVAAGSRQTLAAYDLSRQEFAALRAARNAEDRAARELAELLRMAVVQGLTQPGRTVVLDDTPEPVLLDELDD
jgi:LPS-assembly lipoprotein